MDSDKNLYHSVSYDNDVHSFENGPTIENLSVPTIRSWSDKGIREFMAGEKARTLPELAKDIESILRKSTSVEDETYALFTCIVLASYFVGQMNAIPFLHLTGGFNSGKSATGVAILKLCFNSYE